MNLTPYQLQIVTLIDNQVLKIIERGKTVQGDDEAIIEMMPDYADGFKHLLDTLKQGEMDELCLKYSGFYRFAKMMERLAEGIEAGIFDDIIGR